MLLNSKGKFLVAGAQWELLGVLAQPLGCVAIPLQDSLAPQLGASLAWLMETLMEGLNFPEAAGGSSCWGRQWKV